MPELKPSTIYCGDNLSILRSFPDNCIDLIYADPPFFSNRHYEIIWNDGAEIRAFEDRWQGGINQYLKWMRDRLLECHRVLKNTGSMYLHCDWHANAYLRIVMDKLFGYHNLRNEIVWYYKSSVHPKKDFQRFHDMIFRYSKTDSYVYNMQYQPYSPNTIKRFDKVDDEGRRYKEVMKRGNKYIVYMKLNGMPLGDVWDISFVIGTSKERIGYPTQKPEALLKRIIEASSNKDDIILDPFCGCGTTIAVAQQLSRKWVGIDVSPTACRMMATRLNKLGVVANLENMPETIEHLKSINPFEFQSWVIHHITGKPPSKKTGDMGIDGYDFSGKPIQVKQSSDIGRNVIDNFETAIRRAGYNEGTIYAFSFVKGAYEEIARANLNDNTYIKLTTIHDLLL